MRTWKIRKAFALAEETDLARANEALVLFLQTRHVVTVVRVGVVALKSLFDGPRAALEVKALDSSTGRERGGPEGLGEFAGLQEGILMYVRADAVP